MNSISVNTSVTTQVDDARNTLSTNTLTNVSSSNYVASSTTLTGSSWTSISVGSCADVSLLTIINNDNVYSQSLIAISGSANGYPMGGMIYPGFQYTTNWSGSITLAGRVIGSYAPAVSGTFVQQGLGVIEVIAQQS